jgi:hypothetical protein
MANLKINILAQDKTKGALRSVKGGLSSIKNAVFSLKGAFVGLGSAVALRGISNVASNFEDLRDSLSSVTGGVRQGAKAFDFVNDFALKSQFSVEQLTTSFITLKASGVEPTEKLLRVFTDTAAVTTDQIGTLDAMTRVFSRGVQGGLGLEELNQIADRGVPVFKILEEQLGITRLEIAKFGQTTEGARKILNALEVGFNKAFAGATEEKLDNLSTSSSNLGIAFRGTLDDIGKAGFTGALTDMNNTLAETLKALEPVTKTLGKVLGSIVEKLTKALDSLNTAIQVSYDLYVQLRELLGVPLPKAPVIDIDKGNLEGATEEIIKQKNLLQKIGEVLKTEVNKRVETLKTEFNNVHKTIAEGIVIGIGQISRSIAETIILGKDFGESLKKIAQSIVINIIAKTIEYIALLGIQKILGIELENQDKKQLIAMKKKTAELKKQVGFSLILATLGFFTGGSFLSTSGGSMKRASGGSVQKGQPYMVGEQGAELFIPNQSGQITQSARGTGGGETNVNFTINATDVRGVKELLIDNRATIVNVINSALNEKGKEALV